jgi:hypothetical protein
MENSDLEHERKQIISRIKQLKQDIQFKKDELTNIKKNTIELINLEELKIQNEVNIYNQERERLIEIYNRTVNDFQKTHDEQMVIKNQHQDIIDKANQDILLKTLEINRLKSLKQINRRNQIKYNQNEIKYIRQLNRQIKILQNEIEQLSFDINNSQKYLENEKNKFERKKQSDEINIREKMNTSQSKLDNILSMITEKENIISKLKSKFIETKAQHIPLIIDNHLKELNELKNNKQIHESQFTNIYEQYLEWKKQQIPEFFNNIENEILQKTNRREYCLAQIKALKHKHEKKNLKYTMIIEEENKDIKPINDEIKANYLSINLHKKHIENITIRIEDEKEKHLDYLSIIDKDIDRSLERLEIFKKRIQKNIEMIENNRKNQELEIEKQIENIELNIKEHRYQELILDEKITNLNNF